MHTSMGQVPVGKEDRERKGPEVWTVECRIKATSLVAYEEVAAAMTKCLKEALPLSLDIRSEEALQGQLYALCASTAYATDIATIRLDLDHPNKDQLILEASDHLHVYVYQLVDDMSHHLSSSSSVNMLEDDLIDEEDEEAHSALADECPLPSRCFEGLWSNLIYEPGIKPRLLRYAETAMLLTDRAVNPHLISFHRTLLLHGPPGTGKTSLARALSQQMAIRLSNRFPRACLVEVRAHSLFSRWFSESGKLVARAFREVRQRAQDPQCLVCVLIDEVESLTAARQAALSGTEPADAIRAVNAVLTQLDKMTRYPNVFILTTSNMDQAIDPAFIDRTDLKEYIGYPSISAIRTILSSTIEEMIRKDILLPPPSANLLTAVSNDSLIPLAEKCQGWSGRTLRRLPFLALGLFPSPMTSKIPLDQWLRALHQVSEEERAREARLTTSQPSSF
ncbi:MAG: P-loop containing nucleoside triphosphate hydrolase protein [Piptocephalis tieghemiana]|nr:MAG: P-loop containing nucleoside triphosphate hydrolase protein [Piptocephalis tieghemiana]